MGNGTAASSTAIKDNANLADFQPMPPLSAEQYDALRAEIESHGVVVPVTVDQHGRILDGNNRSAIAAELGIDCPTTTVVVADDEEAGDLAVSLNCARRHLTQEQKRGLIRAELARRPGDSDRSVTRRVGCSPSTVGTVRSDWRAEAEERTVRIREEIDRGHDHLAMAAAALHRPDGDRAGMPWQGVGDVLERSMRGELGQKYDSELLDEFWHVTLGGFFDTVRATDCPPQCLVCTTEDRSWRDAHPDQVWRNAESQVSNLDTAEVAP